MSAFAFIAHIRAKPGKRQALIDLNVEMMQVTHTEPGVKIYAFNTEADKPDDFWYYDYYESQAAFDLHCATPEYQAMMGKLPELADVVYASKLNPFGPTKSIPVGGEQ